jgi:hypothetical protein
VPSAPRRRGGPSVEVAALDAASLDAASLDAASLDAARTTRNRTTRDARGGPSAAHALVMATTQQRRR